LEEFLNRTYKSQEGCPVAETLDVIGDRWTLLMLRDLVIHGDRKFTELLDSLQGISPRLLAGRIRQLEQQDVIEGVRYSDHPPREMYRLTEKGKDLRPVVRAIAEWGYKHQLDDRGRAAWKAPWKRTSP
jgi:DNA-binding HxlR family transcriptional regulator